MPRPILVVKFKRTIGGYVAVNGNGDFICVVLRSQTGWVAKTRDSFPLVRYGDTRMEAVSKLAYIL